jgi:hypothetical protein
MKRRRKDNVDRINDAWWSKIERNDACLPACLLAFLFAYLPAYHLFLRFKISLLIIIIIIIMCN